MEQWRKVFRASASLLPSAGLEALEKALETDDPRLLQGATMTPPALQCVMDWPVEAACLWGFCGWQDGRETVVEVEEFFSRMCFQTGQIMNEPAGCRWFLNWYDDTPRDQMRRELLPEVRAELARRRKILESV